MTLVAMQLVDTEELNSFDALSAYMPPGTASAPQHFGAPHADEPDPKFQRRDKGAAGKGRGAPPKREREQVSHEGSFDHHRAAGSYSDRWHHWTYDPRQSELDYLRNQVSMLQRIVLRHEDALCLMRQEVAFIVHFRIGVAASLVPAVYRSQAGWREIYRTQPSKLAAPMRNTLLECVLKELRQRLRSLTDEASKEARENMITAGWLVTKGATQPDSWQWTFLSWDAQRKIQIVNSARPLISHQKVLDSIDVLLDGLAKPDSLTRFQPLRKVTEQMSGASVGFALQYPFKGDLAATMYAATLDICNSSALQLIAAQIRVDRGQRSGLANAIARSGR